MNAEELFLKSGASAGVYYCGKCHVVHGELSDAEKCCKPDICACGAECSRHWTKCSACQHKDAHVRAVQAHAKAPKHTLLSDYTDDYVYVDGDDEPITVDELCDRLDGEPGLTELVYACTSWRPSIDIDAAIEHALDDAYDGAEAAISAKARTQLREYVDNWCSAHMPVVFGQDEKHAIDIPERYPLYCVDRGCDVDSERQYAGPFLTHGEAMDHINPAEEPSATVRRCRQLHPCDIAFDPSDVDLAEYTFDGLIDELDEAACSGNLPECAWHRSGERIVIGKYDDGTLPSVRDFGTWISDHVALEAYICEGDE